MPILVEHHGTEIVATHDDFFNRPNPGPCNYWERISKIDMIHKARDKPPQTILLIESSVVIAISNDIVREWIPFPQ